MNVEYVSTSSLIPYEFNNRKHEEKQIERIAKSIKEFGFNQPIIIDENRVVLVGHGRLLAAKHLKIKEVPVLQLIDLSETKKKAYRILDNKLQNDSTWDLNNLELELGALEDNGFDLPEWGLDDLIGLFKEEEPEVEEDEFEASEQDETFVKRGDVIELGRHTLVCDDCTKAEPLPCPANMWITDPPYGVAYKGKTKEALEIENDNLGEEGTAELWKNATAYALDNLVDGGACYASVPSGVLYYTFLKEWVELLIYRQQLIWAKGSMVLGHSDYHYKHEPILYGWKAGGAHYFTSDRTKTSVLEYGKPSRNGEHPTMKPVELWAELIANSSKKGDVVLDTFLGSGTTLIACEQLGRVCYGIEIDPKYCQVIIERYQKHCQKSGKPFICKINGDPFTFDSIKGKNE